MMWANPANWSSTTFELKSLNFLASHFAVTISVTTFDPEKLKKEWKNLKLTVNSYYKKVKASQLWERILQYRQNKFPNICLLVEIVIAVGMSNSVVESCFSFLSAMLSDRRLSLKQNDMENLILIIKANHYLWSEEECNEIIEIELEKFTTEKKRKLQLDSRSFCQLGPKRKRTSSVSSKSSSSSENSDAHNRDNVNDEDVNDSESDCDNEEEDSDEDDESNKDGYAYSDNVEEGQTDTDDNYEDNNDNHNDTDNSRAVRSDQHDSQ